MDTRNPIPEVIRQRKSVRSFRDEAAPASILDSFRTSLDAARQGPLGSPCRFALFDTRDGAGEEPAPGGTYGLIRGARLFFTGAVKRGGFDLEDFGYLFETLVLRATDMGLGTCWLGASFDRKGYARLLRAGPEERVPAASPLGLAADKPQVLDAVIRLAARSRHRKAADAIFFDRDFDHGLDPAEAGPAALCLEMVRLAPSARNRQPWRIVKEGHRFHFFVQRTSPPAVDPGLDLARVDMGIAMCHFDLTAHHLRLPGGFAAEQNRRAVRNLPRDGSLEYIITWKGKSP